VTRNAALTVFALILGGMVLLWALKLAFKLILVAAVAFAAVAVYYHVRERIGGGRK
jgi:hypothetical protein